MGSRCSKSPSAIAEAASDIARTRRLMTPEKAKPSRPAISSDIQNVTQRRERTESRIASSARDGARGDDDSLVGCPEPLEMECDAMTQPSSLRSMVTYGGLVRLPAVARSLRAPRRRATGRRRSRAAHRPCRRPRFPRRRCRGTRATLLRRPTRLSGVTGKSGSSR